MKKLLFLALVLFLAPLNVLASDSFPAFPMSFYGEVKLNNAGLPVNSKVYAYAGDQLKGEVTVNEQGIYGYDSPLKQKLLIGEYSGSEITFKYSLPGETTIRSSNPAVKYSGSFEAGKTLSLNIIFSTGSSGGSSGGGGGGSAPVVPPVETPPVDTPPEPEVLGIKLSAGRLLAQEGIQGAAVYYVAPNDKKYVFPDSKTYFTWYNNFDGVERVGLEILDSYSDGGVMPYRAGTKLITHQNTARVYAVEPEGIIRYIPSEETAIDLYGSNWAVLVQDVDPGFFSIAYKLREELSNLLPTGTLAENNGQYYYIDNGSKRKFETLNLLEENGFDRQYLLKINDLSRYSEGLLINTIE